MLWDNGNLTTSFFHLTWARGSCWKRPKLAATSAVNRVDVKEKGDKQGVAMPGPGCNNTAALEEWTNFPAASPFGSGKR